MSKVKKAVSNDESGLYKDKEGVVYTKEEWYNRAKICFGWVKQGSDESELFGRKAIDFVDRETAEQYLKENREGLLKNIREEFNIPNDLEVTVGVANKLKAIYPDLENKEVADRIGEDTYCPFCGDFRDFYTDTYTGRIECEICGAGHTMIEVIECNGDLGGDE